MKNILLSIFALALASAACSTSDLTPTVVPPTPTFDVRQPDKALTQQAALAAPTTAPVSDTFTPTTESSEPVIETATSTPEPSLTTAPVTETSGAPSEVSATPTTSETGGPTLTPTLGILTYGTLPPAVPFSKVTLINKSKAQAYISLQNYPTEGNVAILEYPVKKRVEVKAPLGHYVYVVWVGGNKIAGSFTLHKGNDITITIFKDKVTIVQ